MKKYMVYMDDGRDCFKVAIPAVQGNGEVIAVKNITEEYPISVDAVADALKRAGFGEVEMMLIIRTLTSTEIAE